MFEFLIYLRPTWNYRLAAKMPFPVLVDYRKLAQPIAEVALDISYESETARLMDYAYQALIRGYIPSKSEALDLNGLEEIKDLQANYRFVRKYFSRVWNLYVLILRLVNFKNPFREIKHYRRAKKLKPLNLFAEEVRQHQAYASFQSKLIDQRPLVSIIIPTLHRYKYLSDVLDDLEQQDYSNFEVIVCDQSDKIDYQIYQREKLEIILIEQKEKALWLARNRCIKQSKGDYLLLFDDDSRVETNWIREHLKCMDFFEVQVSAGVTHTLVGHGLSSKESYFHLSDVFDTGNGMVHRKVFEQAGYFDRQFEKQRMGDGEFGLRLMLNGFPVISNPYAQRVHLKVKDGGLREMGSWDALRPKKLFASRPVPSVLYLKRKYFGNRATRYFLIQVMPFSMIPYKWKKSKGLKILYVLLCPFLALFLFYVVAKSWRLAGRKILEGYLGPFELSKAEK